MHPRRRQRLIVRDELFRAADDVHVNADDVNRAKILGQIAYHLTQHPEIGRKVAYKGGAILKLLEGSPRFSRYLDGAAVSGRAIKRRWIVEALSTDAARAVVIRVPRIVNESTGSFTYPVIECRAIAGQSPINVRLSMNWREPLLLEPAWVRIEIHGIGDADIPVLNRAERVSEKVRAFIERGSTNDAFDLYWFANKLRQQDWVALPDLVARKLGFSGHDLAGDLDAMFERAISVAKEEWPGESVIGGGAPPWDTVEPKVRRFLKTLPNRRGPIPA
jgi:predicted nucleotidyltransferase component of viral defense system